MTLKSEQFILGGDVMLRVNDLCAGYGELMILNGFGIALESQQIVAVLGRNGIGKTTLVKTLAGLIKTRSGSITIDGQDITNMSPPQRARMGASRSTALPPSSCMTLTVFPLSWPKR